jgi:hypothetical protein
MRLANSAVSSGATAVAAVNRTAPAQSFRSHPRARQDGRQECAELREGVDYRAAKGERPAVEQALTCDKVTAPQEVA